MTLEQRKRCKRIHLAIKGVLNDIKCATRTRKMQTKGTSKDAVVVRCARRFFHIKCVSRCNRKQPKFKWSHRILIWERRAIVSTEKRQKRRPKNTQRINDQIADFFSEQFSWSLSFCFSFGFACCRLHHVQTMNQNDSKKKMNFLKAKMKKQRNYEICRVYFAVWPWYRLNIWALKSQSKFTFIIPRVFG